MKDNTIRREEFKNLKLRQEQLFRKMCPLLLEYNRIGERMEQIKDEIKQGRKKQG